MNDILEMIDDLRELQALYDTGELRNINFGIMLKKYEDRVEQFERDMEAELDQYQLFFADTPFAYNPKHEV